MFVHNSDLECGKKFGVEKLPSFVFFRKFEERTVVYEGFEDSQEKQNDLDDFVANVMLPSSFEVNDDTFNKLIGLKRPAVILFRNDGVDQNSQFMQTYKMAAKEL